MTSQTGWREARSLRERGVGVQWAALLFLSVLFVLALEAARLPAALLLGPMAAAIVIAAAEGTLRVPPWPFYAAQGVIGCMIARVFTPSLLGAMVKDWPLFLAAVIAVIAASSALGWLLTRWRVLPGTTAVWGSSPGAATAMVLMAEAYGADVRLVAFMQYLRVVMVAIVASAVARLWTTTSGGAAAEVLWFPPIAWTPFVATLALAAAGVIGGVLLKIPAGPLLAPLAIGAALHGAGLVTIELPPWLLAASYAIVGWSIGLRFTRPILVHALHALPRVLASILTLIAICGGFAFVLTRWAGIDPLTAYLATSPGGADTVAIISASAKVDVPFVMALQTARFVIVLLVGPALARFIADRHSGAARRGA
jgi:membrane AbrB-like protein